MRARTISLRASAVTSSSYFRTIDRFSEEAFQYGSPHHPRTAASRSATKAMTVASAPASALPRKAAADLDAKQLLLNADIALYRAKGAGRNRHEFFSKDARRTIIAAKRLSDEMLLGLERNEFIPFYQLQFHAQTLEVAGVETLARWRHPEHGIADTRPLPDDCRRSRRRLGDRRPDPRKRAG